MNKKLKGKLTGVLTVLVGMILFSLFFLLSRYANYGPIESSLVFGVIGLGITTLIVTFVVVSLFDYGLLQICLSSFISSVTYMNFYYRNIEIRSSFWVLVFETSFEIIFFILLSFGLLHLLRGGKFGKKKKK